MGDDEEDTRTEFQKLVGSKVIKVQMKHYNDLEMSDRMAVIMDATNVIEGRKELYSKDKYSGPNAAEDFFRDYPEFEKILDDSEIKAVRDAEISKADVEIESCWGVNWDRNEIAYLMFTSVAIEGDFKITDEGNFARQDANAFCGVKHITDTKAIENQFDEKDDLIRRHTKPADLGIDTEVTYVGGEMKVNSTTRDVNTYNSEHFARSIVYYGKNHDKEFMTKVLSGCKHIADASTLKGLIRVKMKLIDNWMKEFGISESELTSVPISPSYGSSESSSSTTDSPASGCFIATAAYGTPFSEDIDVLRNWRDDFLIPNFLGKTFVNIYYRLSPPIADNIRESKSKRYYTRKTIHPFIKILSGNYNRKRKKNTESKN